jgi:hypothetical protein
MVEITETLYARDREAWRDWLKKHHSDKQEIWLDAKRPETRARRLARAIKAMLRKEPMGMGWKMED